MCFLKKKKRVDDLFVLILMHMHEFSEGKKHSAESLYRKGYFYVFIACREAQ